MRVKINGVAFSAERLIIDHCQYGSTVTAVLTHGGWFYAASIDGTLSVSDILLEDRIGLLGAEGFFSDGELITVEKRGGPLCITGNNSKCVAELTPSGGRDFRVYVNWSEDWSDQPPYDYDN